MPDGKLSRGLSYDIMRPSSERNEGGVMPLKVSTKEYKHADLIQLSGRVDGSTAPQLEHAMKKIQNDGRYRIVVDLAETDFVASAGLRVLLSAQKEAHRFNRGDV